MVELADTPDLGSGAKACRFKSCYPYQKGYKIDAAKENPDKIGVFTVYTDKFQRTVLQINRTMNGGEILCSFFMAYQMILKNGWN